MAQLETTGSIPPRLIEAGRSRTGTADSATSIRVWIPKIAITAAIIGGGIVIAFGALGLRWSQLQWLVAALGVGIGFGLQEIIANFISGLIILFERPIRVGDVVSTGNEEGVVTRIRMWPGDLVRTSEYGRTP